MASSGPARKDFAQRYAELEEQVRLLRLRVFGAHYVPAPTFVMEGLVDINRTFSPGHITNDVYNEGLFVENKRIVAFDGYCASGWVKVTWQSMKGGSLVILADHLIDGNSNRVYLAEPYEVEGYDWILPEIIDASTGATNFSCTYIVEAETTVESGRSRDLAGQIPGGVGPSNPPPGELDPDFPPPPVEGSSPPEGQFTNLVLDEQFNSGSYPDSSRWRVYDSPGHAGNGRRDPAAFSIVNGQLVITAWWDGSNIRTGGMAHRQDFLYCRMEVRARCEPDPSGQLSSLALTWPGSENWPHDGELDFWETGHSNDSDRNPFYSYLHWYGADQGSDQTQLVHNYSAVDWHTITMDWTPNSITVWIDGVFGGQLTDRSKIPSVPHHLCLQQDAFSNFALPYNIHAYYDYARIWV